MNTIKDTLNLFKNTVEIVGKNKDILKPTWAQAKIGALFFVLLIGSLGLLFVPGLRGVGQLGIVIMLFVLMILFPFIEVKFKAAQSWIVYQTFIGKESTYKDGLDRARKNKGDIFVLGVLDILMTYLSRQLKNKSNSGVGMIFKILLAAIAKAIEEGWDLVGNFLLPASIVTEKTIGEAAKDLKNLKNNVPGALAGVFGIDFVGNALKSIVSGIFIVGIIIGAALLYFTGTWFPLVVLILLLMGFNLAVNIAVEMIKVVYFTLFYVSISMPEKIPENLKAEIVSYLNYKK